MGYKTVAISTEGENESAMRELKFPPHTFIDGMKDDVGKMLMKMGGAKVILCSSLWSSSVSSSR